MTTTARLLSVTTLLLAGCIESPGSQEESEGDIGIAGSDILTTNAITMNALTMNALTMNALTMNALTMNALSPSSLAAIRAASAAGDTTRLLLKYMVSCAFDATQSFDFTWTDESNVVHGETYWGSLALATNWSIKPLTTLDQEWVTACLVSRVNWYGVSVPVSARGATGGLKITDPVELSTYQQEEGAFWGNLFTESPHAYSCYEGTNEGHSRSALRECAAGHVDSEGNLVDCEMIQRLGPCTTYCTSGARKGEYYPRCQDSTGTDAVQTNAVITIFLQ